MEAMRSTEPGVMEYELNALAEFILSRNGAQAKAYRSSIDGGALRDLGHRAGDARRGTFAGLSAGVLTFETIVRSNGGTARLIGSWRMRHDKRRTSVEERCARPEGASI